MNLVLDFRSLSKIANTYIAGLKPFLITHQNPQAFCPTVSAVVSLGNLNLPLAIPFGVHLLHRHILPYRLTMSTILFIQPYLRFRLFISDHHYHSTIFDE